MPVIKSEDLVKLQERTSMVLARTVTIKGTDMTEISYVKKGESKVHCVMTKDPDTAVEYTLELLGG